MIRRAVLLASIVVAVAETYRRGYTAPLLFGCRQWAAARPDWCLDATTSPDPAGRGSGRHSLGSTPV